MHWTHLLATGVRAFRGLFCVILGQFGSFSGCPHSPLIFAGIWPQFTILRHSQSVNLVRDPNHLLESIESFRCTLASITGTFALTYNIEGGGKEIPPAVVLNGCRGTDLRDIKSLQSG
mmetsp:Transcript_27714/g.44297  ORF Transcript_27714/g.44297 Transcript_27714/m.44297 type:complete len:118 (-) Transcript_27714:201-554(-)